MLVDQWFPFFDVGKTLEEMDRALDQVGRPLGLRSVPRGTFPAINIYQQDDGIVMMAEVPGVEPENLDLTVLNDSVTLKGRREEKDNVDGNRVYRRERFQGAFARTVTLPAAINPDSVKAHYAHGVLTVRMEKAESAKVRKIAIQS
ncbi:MAG TPA: Hsp20/alpha crystallin family protein [Sedimentisphaerales bacterium]|nr:Hsp20/alpha crystallin family protein [Sedimentisphaerales bacterium]HQG48690.1 Hsp20/alpha crystallin family protein [Sedimentisphaerales bacterium]HQI28130.1 Hsp20/alpha crystallin family protein [Sedimentisphaerales bacterium]